MMRDARSVRVNRERVDQERLKKVREVVQSSVSRMKNAPTVLQWSSFDTTLPEPLELAAVARRVYRTGMGDVKFLLHTARLMLATYDLSSRGTPTAVYIAMTNARTACCVEWPREWEKRAEARLYAFYEEHLRKQRESLAPRLTKAWNQK